jgi:hypothetical protein
MAVAEKAASIGLQGSLQALLAEVNSLFPRISSFFTKY